MISKKTIYALKALQYLAEQPGDRPVLIAEMSQSGTIPKKFLEFILLTLRKSGVLQSRIGKGGGYLLALPPSKISLGTIIRSLEGDIAPLPCLNETTRTRCEECQNERTCGVKLIMTDVSVAVSTIIDKLTLADMLARSNDERQKLSETIDYSI